MPLVDKRIDLERDDNGVTHIWCTLCGETLETKRGGFTIGESDGLIEEHYNFGCIVRDQEEHQEEENYE